MHIQTHVLSGWCAGNCLPLTARQRLMCMIAASVPDVDGVGIIVWPINHELGQKLYWDYHHVLGHGAIFAVIVAGILAIFSPRKFLSFAIYFALVHLHLALDVLGSGPGWKIHYFWPFSKWGYAISWGWPLFSWQNILAFCVLLLWTVLIARFCRRTPLESLMPKLDRQLVALVRPTPEPSMINETAIEK